MKTLSEIKKAMNVKFPKTSVKYEDANGNAKCYRTGDDKLIKMIATGVTLSPMDCTDVKSNKIHNKFTEVVEFLKSLGGTITHNGNGSAIVDFIKPSKDLEKPDSGYRFSITKEYFRSSYLYDSSYKTAFIDVYICKI